ncbi:MAG TPA: hypothetical protein VHR72_06185, partial [Gemmataceae bacterium]|nr:hypothetical protein [Gemmataceae bacterium]
MNLRSSPWLPATLLLLVVLVGGPLHLRMATWPDADIFDMMARTVFRGGVAYRDLATNSMPGMMWAQMPVRVLLGWSMIALRAVDLVVFGLIVLLLSAWPEDGNPARRLWRAIPLVLSYFAMSEYVHCQRDVWMLLPVAAAIHVHGWSPATWRAELGRGLLAGMLWGAAVWIKPHAIVPAIAVWTCASLGRSWSRIVIDAAGTLLGGLAIGAAGVAWLVGTGAWPAFAEYVFVWNREYLEHWQAGPIYRLGVLAEKLFPWNVVHLAAIPLSVWAIVRPPAPTLRLLAAAYLGWLLQAAGFQAFYDYNYYVPVLLGWAVVLRWADFRGLVRGAAIGGVLALLVVHPMFRPARISAWPSCWLPGRDAELRDRLSLYPVADWVALEAVEEFLHAQEAKDGEVLSFDWRTSRIYLDLDLEPPNPQMTPFNVALQWPSRYFALQDELARTKQKFVVVDIQVPQVP